MNAPLPAGHLVEAKIEYLPCSALAPSETHVQQLRRKRYSMDSLADLRMSVAKSGVQSPLVVRKLAALRGLATHEIAFGERRWRASQQAGLAHVPCIVRELNDAEVLEVQLIENIQREDLHPLEEAAGYDEYIKLAKIKPEDLGERLGKSRSWIYSRLNLLKLEGPAQEALQAGQLDVSRALVVAAVAQPNQRAEALRLALETNHDGKHVYSVRELRAKVLDEKLTMKLKGAPFDMHDATLLPEMKDCDGCRFRTGNCDPEALDPDVCTNMACFQLKVQAHSKRRRQAILDAGGKVLKGEDARKLSPSVKTVYGHVDLDERCGWDEFPEEQPGVPKDFQGEMDEHPAFAAWLEREKLWVPRTYRELLDGMKYSIVAIEDPKGKQLRELVPFKEAQALLKKKGIDLPSYANKKRPDMSHRGSADDRAKAQQREESRQAQEEQRRKNEMLVKQRVLKEVWPKLSGKLDRETLLAMADDNGRPEGLQLLFGHRDLKKLKEVDLIKLIVYGDIVWPAINDYSNGHELYKVAAKVKVNVEGIRKQVAKELEAATTKGDKK